MAMVGETIAEDFEYIDDVNIISKISLDNEEKDL
tara:strand:- start:84 stop:185 length:102 start_codon:yes stop_codon:yes gene_type:complete